MEEVKFGKYQLVEQIGVGRIAQVWKTRITGIKGMDQYLVIKRLLPHLSTKKAVLDIFLGEAKKIVGLRHENIVRVYDFGSIEGTPYVAQEYVDGTDLSAFMEAMRKRGQALGVEHAVYIMEKIGAALDFAHKQEIIHGNLRPQDVLISRRGEVKVCDFAICLAALAGDMEEEVLKKAAPYLSPEYILDRTLNVKTDIFGAGMIFYELLTGQPWLGGDPARALSALRDRGFDPAKEVPEDLPQGLQDILKRALARDPGARYLSPTIMYEEVKRVARTFAAKGTSEDISKYMAGLFPKQASAEIPSKGEGAEAAKREVQERAEAASVPKPPSKPLDKKIIAGGVAGALILVIALIFLLTGKKEEKAPPPSGSGPAQATRVAAQGEPSSRSGGQAGAEEERVAEESPSKEGAGSKPSQELASPGEAELQKGLQALSEGRYDQAIEVFKGIISKYPELEQEASSPYSHALELKAKAIVESEPKQAEKLLKQAISLNPENVEAHFQLGLLYGDQKKYDKAIKEYKRVVELDPQYPDAYFNLGYIYAIKKDYKNAEAAYKEVVALVPPYLDEALFNLAMVQKRLGKKEACIQNLKRAIIVNPDNKLAKRYLKRMTGR